MSIFIRHITLKNLGPIKSFDYQLGSFNVVYSLNEGGKTLITEFLTSSLFKNKERFRKTARDVSAAGKITVSGLEEEDVSFTLKNSNYLEKYISEEDAKFSNMARLAVVRGADVAIADEKDANGGINREIVRKILSKTGEFTRIRKGIKKTTREAELQGLDVVINSKQGDVGELTDLKKKLKHTSSLLQEVEKNYGGGERGLLEVELKKLEQEKEKQLKAKKHYAFLLSEKLKKIEEKLRQIEEDDINDLSNKIYNYFYEKKNTLREAQKKAVKVKKEAKKYHWLKQVKELYSLYSSSKVNGIILIIPFATLLLATVFAILSQTELTLAFILLTTFVLAYYFYIQSKTKPKKDNSVKLKELKESFKNKTGEQLTEDVLLAKLSEAEEQYKIYRERISDFRDKKRRIKQLKEDIEKIFYRTIGEKIEEEEWEESVSSLVKEKETLKEEKYQQISRLDALNVNSSDYITNPTEEKFSEEKLNEIEAKMEKNKEKQKDIISSLEELKQRICDVTEDTISTNWSTIINNLEKEKSNLEEEVTEKRAKIVGEKITSDVLKELMEKEDEKIEERLASDEIKNLLSKFTGGRYENISLVDDGLILSSPHGEEFKIDELSTGTKEQVMLALRVGFLSSVLGNRKAFFLLDDAFQHSDWERREKLIKGLYKLSKEGWQIIYFTMDKHILELFEKTGAKSKEFKKITI